MKTLRISKEAYARLRKRRRPNESVSQAVERMAFELSARGVGRSPTVYVLETHLVMHQVGTGNQDWISKPPSR